MSSQAHNQQPLQAAVQQAVVEAFRAAAAGSDGGPFGPQGPAGALTEFERQLEQVQITGARDRKVLSRVLLDVAQADGRIAPEEQTFLQRFAGLPSAEELQHVPVSGAELRQITPAARETVLMIAWALALVDHDLSPQERALIDRHAEELGIDPARARALRQAAYDFITEIAQRHGHS